MDRQHPTRQPPRPAPGRDADRQAQERLAIEQHHARLHRQHELDELDKDHPEEHR